MTGDLELLGGKPETPEKIPRSRDWNQQQIQPTHGVKSGNRTWATPVKGEYSYYFAIPASQILSTNP